MIISICIPCMNRLYDLEKVLPTLVIAANNSPPVEIMILNYNSQDNLSSYIQEMQRTVKFVAGNKLACRRYTGRDHYHMAHARNLSVLASKGTYVVISSADVLMKPDYLQRLRPIIETDYTWVRHEDRFVGVFCVSRDEFISAGGFDERFEFYGKEDKDILARLERRGTPHVKIRASLDLLPTPWPEKLKNYRLPLSRREMGKRSKAIYQENVNAGVLVANRESEWGQWE